MFKKTIFQNTVNKHRTQYTEHRHRTQNTNTANFRSYLKQVYQFTILHSLFAFSVDQCERTLIAEYLLIMQEVGCSNLHGVVLQVRHSEVNIGIMAPNG